MAKRAASRSEGSALDWADAARALLGSASGGARLGHKSMLTSLFLLTPLFATASSSVSEALESPMGEVMSACTIPSRSVDDRQALLQAKGWMEPTDVERLKSAMAAALLVTSQPNSLQRNAWVERRDWTTSLMVNWPSSNDLLMTKDSAFVSIKSQDKTDFATCFFGNLADPLAEHLFNDLEKLGDRAAYRDWSYGRYGEIFTTSRDKKDNPWRTTITFYDFQLDSVAPLIAPPVGASVAATFITRDRKVPQ